MKIGGKETRESGGLTRSVPGPRRREVSGKLGRTLSGKKAGPLTQEDALFSLIGIGESKVPGGAASKKHEYCR